MRAIAQVIGRLITVLVDKGLIDNDDALFILQPLNDDKESEAKNEQE